MTTYTAANERDALASAVCSVLTKNACPDLLEMIAAKVVNNIDPVAVKKLLGLDDYNESSNIVLAAVREKFAR